MYDDDVGHDDGDVDDDDDDDNDVDDDDDGDHHNDDHVDINTRRRVSPTWSYYYY